MWETSVTDAAGHLLSLCEEPAPQTPPPGYRYLTRHPSMHWTNYAVPGADLDSLPDCTIERCQPGCPDADWRKLLDGRTTAETVRTWVAANGEFWYMPDGEPDEARRLADIDPVEAAERVLGPWTEALPDDRIPVAEGDTIARPEPPDLFGLFYSGLSNLIAGSPDTGKSWAVLAATAEAAVAGRVLWLDAEDTAETFSRRCLILGCPELTTSTEVRRINHGDWIMAEPEHIEACFRWLSDGFGPGLIVIDSGTASGSGDNLDQWTSWTRRHLPGPGAGVGSILVEHVVKNPDDRHGQGAGSRAKLAAIRGMALLIDELEGTPWAPATDTSPPRPGGFALYCSKNKPGGSGWAKGDRIGVLHGQPGDDGRLALTVQVGGRSASLTDAVARYVADNPGQPTRKVNKAVPGRRDDVAAAIIRAENEGLIVRTAGPRGAKFCYPPDHPQPTSTHQYPEPRVLLDDPY